MDEFEKRKREVLRPVFFEAGAALYQCQTFETAIAYLMYLLAKAGARGFDEAKAVAVLEDESKKTAGQLIHDLRKHLEVGAGIEEVLANALKARNKFIHRYLVDNVERMTDVVAQADLIDEIRLLRMEVKKAEQKLDPLIRQLAKVVEGVSIDAIQDEEKQRFMKDTRRH